ncbi:MAG TPA: hypothetical protein VI670_17480 [Thermoanaerobaculia bacterium]|jgi:hypothetical protein
MKLVVMLRIAIGTPLLALGLWIIVLNWAVVWTAKVGRKKVPSWTPLLGGVLAAAGLALIPNTSHWWWLPFLVDWGCLPGLVHTVLMYRRTF